MPKITDIVAQKRNHNLYSIYIDGRFRFSVSDLDLSNSHLHVDQEFSEEQLIELIRQYQFKKAYHRSLDYIARRMRSEQELRDYLKDKNYEPESIDQVIVRLKEQKLVDDGQFAELWIKNRNLIKPRSVRQLDNELYKKGINKETRQILLTQQVDIELQNALQLLEKKLKTPAGKDKQKLISYLARQGFSYNTIKKAVELAAREN